MGHNNNNAGISWLPKGFKSNPEYGHTDKYDTILQDAMYNTKHHYDPIKQAKKEKNEENNQLLLHFMKMNFMVLWNEKGQEKICRCGAKTLCYMDKIEIRYRKDGKVKILHLGGKICKDCGRKYIVRKELLEKYYKIEGRQKI